MFSITNTKEGAWSAMPLSTPAPARAAAVASPLQSTTVRGHTTSGSFQARARTWTRQGPSACASATVACNTTVTFPDSPITASATRAKAGMGNGSTQRPASSRSGPATGGALQPRGEFLHKPAGDRQGFRVRRVPQIQSADGAHLGGRGQPAQKTVSLQQHHLRAGPPGRGGRCHARRAAADDKHVAGNGGRTGSKSVGHFVCRRMYWP